MNHPQPAEAPAELIRPEQGDQPVQVSPEASSFKADTPASVPAFDIPDVALDAVGLPADVMAQQVPTLGEAAQPVDAGAPITLHDPHGEAAASVASVAELVAEVRAATQAQPDAADTWLVQMQVRIDRLADDVRALNDRLDRFVNHTKV